MLATAAVLLELICLTTNFKLKESSALSVILSLVVSTKRTDVQLSIEHHILDCEEINQVKEKLVLVFRELESLIHIQKKGTQTKQ